MFFKHRARFFLFFFAASYSLAASFGYVWQNNLDAASEKDEEILYSQASEGDFVAQGFSPALEGDQEGEQKAFQRIRPVAGGYDLELGFPDFHGNRASVRFSVNGNVLEKYRNQFGYTQRDLDALKAWNASARKRAYEKAVAEGESQRDLDARVAALDRQYRKRLLEYISLRGFKLLPGNLLAVDMPGLVRRNISILKPLALAFDSLAVQHGYDGESLVGTVTSMAQTALLYKVPPPNDGQRRIGGVFPPLEVLVRGWGDCDTKTALVASVLGNWKGIKAVGIAAPRHYLMGVERIPYKGDVFVEHKGSQYVLIEPAGPAWLPPGTVGQETLAMIEASDAFQVESFF